MSIKGVIIHSIIMIQFPSLFTATDGAMDDFFQMIPVTLTFFVGAIDNDTADVSVMILNDDFVEGDETFDLSISNVLSTAMASAGSPDAAAVTITDDDSKYIYDNVFLSMISQ